MTGDRPTTVATGEGKIVVEEDDTERGRCCRRGRN